MRVSYSDDMKNAYFDGHKFRKDSKTGYFLSAKKTDVGHRERLHCYVWRYYAGEIPEGYHVHHLNGDKDCNDFWNLTCIRGEQHTRYHSKKRAEEEHEAICENLRKNAAPKAAEWHGSDAGRQWHSEHAKETVANLTEKRYECAYCGKVFYKKPLGNIKYCSNGCKTKARYRSGVDSEIRRCAGCGGDFVANKYAKTKYCSAECWNRVRRDKSGQGMRG